MLKHRQHPHAALPLPTHDEDSRQDFTVSLRRHLSQNVGPGTYTVFKKVVEPAFIAQHSRPPADADEVRAVMTKNPYYQLWSLCQRTSQEMVWDSVIDTVERNLPSLTADAADDVPVEMPAYLSGFDIHIQPGSYQGHPGCGGAAGAIYDLGVPLYSCCMSGPTNNAGGETVLAYYQRAFPDRNPARILDLGCGIGNSTVPWANAFPRAQVTGIDVAVSMVRYAERRAAALGSKIAFSGQNAEATAFPAESFDVVLGIRLLHETSSPAMANILGETHRLLRPGGVAIFLDGYRVTRREPIQEFLGEWEIYNNNEYFNKTLKTMDVIGAFHRAGFAKGRVRFEKQPSALSVRLTKPGTKGYMTGITEVDLVVAEK
jgi:2-polyprenyl-3-methyl-5-hydroxy-6-metoxy-1,4-benzoquinol methylase